MKFLKLVVLCAAASLAFTRHHQRRNHLQPEIESESNFYF